MKHQILTTIFFICLAFCSCKPLSYGQQPIHNYDKEWKEVNDTLNKGLPQSALVLVKKIYEKAKSDQQDAQMVKSLLQILFLEHQLQDKTDAFTLYELESEIQNTQGAVAAILTSFLAEDYWLYYQRNRYKIYQRTTTEGFKKDDIETWTTEDFHQKIAALYLSSISDEKMLQKTKLSPFDALIMKGNMRHLRPTLYDLLAHRALTYFQSDERDIQKPTYAFEIKQAAAFDPAADFIHRKFPTKDTSSLQYKALLIYQQLLAFHLNDTEHDALIDVDIQRIAFVHDNSVAPNKEDLYFTALNHIAQQYDGIPAADQARYLIALQYENEAQKYTPNGDTTNRYSRTVAKEICEKVLRNAQYAGYDSSEGMINCYNLLNTINTKSFQFSIEKVNIPEKPFRVFLQYRNINSLYLRIIKATEDLKDLLKNQQKANLWTTLASAKYIKNWQQDLPEMKDLQTHGVELKVDGLPIGEYFLLASNKSDFTGNDVNLGTNLFYVSNIGYVNNNNQYFVLNRETGTPLANAKVQLWSRKYDYKSYKYVYNKNGVYHTDAHGYFALKNQDEKQRYVYHLLDITYQDDRLFLDDLNYAYFSNQPEEKEPVTSFHLFSDRSIYRPGQTVYFKGILLSKGPAATEGGVVADEDVTILLTNANYKIIDSLDLTTNQYGSVNGKFQLPQTGMNGRFTISSEIFGGRLSFNVEEYKRPKFYVDYEKIKGSYQVYDTIRITGLAKAYAGNAIDGAQVKYRVVRTPRFLYPWMFWRWWQPPTTSMEIAHGEIQTDKDGKFIIPFQAIPDLTIDKKFSPVFDYKIYADVTDLNGETRSGEKMVSVSYQALTLTTNIPKTLPADSLRSIQVYTQNLNGEFEPALVTMNIEKLKTVDRLIRSRYWNRPDQFVMTKNEYISYFPNDEYDNETDEKSWTLEKEILSASDSSKADGHWNINYKKFKPGTYKIEITAIDKNGKPVKDIQFIELVDEKSTTISRPSYVWSGEMKTIAEPGEKATVEWGTSAKDVFVIYQINHRLNGNSTTDYQYVNFNNEKKTYQYTLTDKDRPGFGVGWLFFKNNRVYQLNQTIAIPWTNKELQIEYATYRNKTLPGSQEKWKIKITGHKKEKLAAEMLASMYDASLDMFSPHQWSRPNIWPTYYNNIRWNESNNFNSLQSLQWQLFSQNNKSLHKQYDYLQNVYQPLVGLRGRVSGLDITSISKGQPTAPNKDEEVVVTSLGISRQKKETGYATEAVEDSAASENDNTAPPTEGVKIRKNFAETAFFYPELYTDSTGAIEFSFTMPEALTKWKFMALAHTKEAAFGYSTMEMQTQKQLMVQPNLPRFLRQGDKMEVQSKIVNLSAKEFTGTVSLQLFNAVTNEPVDGQFRNVMPNQYFTVAAGQSEAVKFPIEIPYQFSDALVWRISAQTINKDSSATENFSDGEENTLPILSNQILVTESLPLPMRGSGKKEFTFEKLLQSGLSETIVNQALTVEYTSNPAWYAVQALPYLMEYPYECAEQTWNRYYANSLASHITQSSPRIQKIFEQWKIKDTAALMSNLEKNQELKSVLLEETPWVLQAKNEAEQKRNIALLFDMVKMSYQLTIALNKLNQMQSSNGGFVWFSGGPDDRYMTQYIMTGIGHLKKLNAIAEGQQIPIDMITNKAIPYLDKKIKDDYDDLIKYKTDLKNYTPGYMVLQYLYMRSFFPEYKIPKASETAYDYFRSRAQQTWNGQSKYMQGMTALALFRTGDNKTPGDILRSLKETAIQNEEMGMYWKATQGWFWYQAPIETQALLIEAFQEIGKDTKTVDDLKTWLLKNKQTTNWKTTKATAEACYALLLQGSDWLSNTPVITINLGHETIKSSDEKQEAGTGYFKKVFDYHHISPRMGHIEVEVKSNNQQQSATWGSVYWQYFENIDKITTAETPLQLTKKLFVEKNTDKGPVISPVNDNDIIKVGDKIKVRIELRVDRDMEYVHMKDMRAASFEPTNVLSRYKYQDGLGYYESTKDASTNFFFNYLRKGTYVFEYTLFAGQAGNFSNGITTIQCMYAPEFTAHSEGVRVTVE